MMNNKRYLIWKILLPVMLIGLFVSCDNFFDTEIGGRITPEQHYKSQLDAQFSYLGCFVYLQEIAEKSVLIDGLRSDMMNVTDNADADMIAISRHEYTPTNPYLDLASYYKLIININEVLPNLPQILELDRDFDSLVLYSYEGALVTMRCWAYFNLAKLNGEVGYVDGSLTEIDPKKPPIYLNKGQIVIQLISELLPYVDEADIYRYPIDHYVLLGELFLELGDYANAAKYLKYAIDGPAYRNNFRVDAAYEDDGWELIFLNSNDQETVMTAVPYSFVDGQKNTLEEWFNPRFNFMVRPADSIINLFLTETAQNDDIGDLYRGVGITYDTTSTGEPFINKYSIDGGIPHSADVILYRAADVHLLLAEALNRGGNQSMALTLLNDGVGSIAGAKPSGWSRWSTNAGVRGRVYLKNRTVPASIVDPLEKTEYIEDLIMEEREKELAFEGKRWFDLVRVATRRNDPAYLADKVAAKFEDPATAEEIRTLLMDPANWYIPLAKVD